MEALHHFLFSFFFVFFIFNSKFLNPPAIRSGRPITHQICIMILHGFMKRLMGFGKDCEILAFLAWKPDEPWLQTATFNSKNVNFLCLATT